MKKAKRILPITLITIMIFSLLIPFGSAFATTPTANYFDNSTSYVLSGANLEKALDNNSTTSADIGYSAQKTITFNSPVDINNVYFKGTYGSLRIHFKDLNGTVLKTMYTNEFSDSANEVPVSLTGVSKILFNHTSTSTFYVNEFDINVTSSTSVDYSGGLADNLPVYLSDSLWNNRGTTANLTDNDVSTTHTLQNYQSPGTSLDTIYIELPTVNTINTVHLLSSSYSGLKMYFYNSSKTELGNTLITSELTNVNYSNVKFIGLLNTEANTKTLQELNFNIGQVSTIVKTEISNLIVVPSETTANITFDGATGYSGVTLTGYKIYLNNVLKGTVSATTTSYDLSGLTNSTDYTIKITSLYSDNTETQGVTKTFKSLTPEQIKNVSDVEVSTTYNKVNLSWNLPEQNIFKHVNIYRKKVENIGFFEGLFSLSGSTVYAEETSTKIFETNGTYFNDLTVQPESTYEYTLTTQSTDGQESEGVTVTAETGEEPEPVIVDDGYSINPDGDYVFKWSEPTTGTVEVLIDGTEYKTVEASLKQVLIPKEDMKYDSWGDPKVSLVPISQYGKVGESSNSGTVLAALKLPFEVNDFLGTVMGILGLVAPIILLTLAIYYFKPLKNLLVRAATRIKKGEVKHE